MAGYTAPVQLGLEVTGGSLLAEADLSLKKFFLPRSSVVESPSILLRVGRNAQSAANGSPAVTFYDGTNALFAQNNTLNLDISGETVSVTFSLHQVQVGHRLIQGWLNRRGNCLGSD